jgi:hypothetical protein
MLRSAGRLVGREGSGMEHDILGMEARRLIIWTTFFPDLFPDARSFWAVL